MKLDKGNMKEMFKDYLYSGAALRFLPQKANHAAPSNRSGNGKGVSTQQEEETLNMHNQLTLAWREEQLIHRSVWPLLIKEHSR